MSELILLRVMNTFDLDVKRVPEALRRVGVIEVSHSTPSQSIDVFRGELPLSSSPRPLIFTIGIKQAVGAILSLRMPDSVDTKNVTPVRAAAHDWFHETWSKTVG